jgi:hypothetical protein
MALRVPTVVRERNRAAARDVVGAVQPPRLARQLGLLLVVLAACSPPGSPSADGQLGTVDVEVIAGPICPVERDPPDPECEPRRVGGARVIVQPGDGRDIVVAEATADAAGHAIIELPAGDYVVVGAEVEGLMGLPEPVMLTVAAGRTVPLTLAYDTGIR